MKKVILMVLILLLFFVSISTLFGESENILSLSAIPGGIIPIGESSSYFKLGGYFSISGIYNSVKFSPFALRGELSFSSIPIITKDSISLYSIFFGPQYNIKVSKNLFISPFILTGYYYGYLTDKSGRNGGNIPIKSGISGTFNFSRSFSLGIDFFYIYNLALFSGIGSTIEITYKIPLTTKAKTPQKEQSKPKLLKSKAKEVKNKGIEIKSDLYPVFPVLYKYYNTSPIGEITIYNREKNELTNISVSFFVEKYMDSPKLCGKIESIKPESDKSLNLYALFSDKVLEITEGTKVLAKIIIDYDISGKTYEIEHTSVLNIYDRNATMWDDNKKAAAFVTAKDPSVLEFSKRIVGWTKMNSIHSVNKNLSTAIAIHEALKLFGVNYVVDPKTPYKEYSKNKFAVDFLQFPRQTLKYSAGDCDDLSILYCSLLESVGIETAFITIPGHIYTAFSLDMSPDKARKSFLRPDELIFFNNKTWIPLEITMVDKDFLAAWEEGAKEWRENKAKNQAKIYPVHKCWEKYEPVGLPGVESNIELPNKLMVVNAFQQEIIKFIDREIYPQVSKLQKQIRKSNNQKKFINKLGVLYARYGLIEKAIIQFNRILEKEEYVPALVNMGNIKYINGDMDGALEFYNRAYNVNPNNPKVLLCIARVNHELENYGIVSKMYAKLQKEDPVLAEQFSYLALRGDEAIRAAKISDVKEVIVWDEE